jgi:hypothetical protein
MLGDGSSVRQALFARYVHTQAGDDDGIARMAYRILIPRRRRCGGADDRRSDRSAWTVGATTPQHSALPARA